MVAPSNTMLDTPGCWPWGCVAIVRGPDLDTIERKRPGSWDPVRDNGIGDNVAAPTVVCGEGGVNSTAVVSTTRLELVRWSGKS